MNVPDRPIVEWWVVYGVFGTLATLALFPWSQGPTERLIGLWERGSDRAWVIGPSLAAFGLSAFVSWRVLRGMDLTIDESAYRFMADLLSHGRLYGHSPPDKLFYDRRFMINDGKVFSPYFLGWPALLAGSTWARLAGVLFVTSPFAVFMAATQLSHPACLFWPRPSRTPATTSASRAAPRRRSPARRAPPREWPRGRSGGPSCGPGAARPCRTGGA